MCMKYVSNPDFLSVLLVFQWRVYGMHRKETKKNLLHMAKLFVLLCIQFAKFSLHTKLLMITSIFFADSEVCLIWFYNTKNLFIFLPDVIYYIQLLILDA